MGVRRRLAHMEVGQAVGLLSGLLVVTWLGLGNKIR